MFPPFDPRIRPFSYWLSVRCKAPGDLKFLCPEVYSPRFDFKAGCLLADFGLNIIL